MPKIALILARAANGVIGADGGLPWHISDELKYFKRVTMGKPLLMGRKTFESIGRPLPGRPNIVITRDQDYTAEGVDVMHDLSSALARAEQLAAASGADEIMVIGGGEIYALALPMADRIYLTEVQLEPDGDAFFELPDKTDWIESCREAHPATEENEVAYSMVVLDRRP